ncbi:MAG: hypothetical protein FDZ69_05610 [Deltaproteobacteria bacterium]|nr:MAG: hypothetical protein FDZ69_05610 [Deltaproteobacteria bacterium]
MLALFDIRTLLLTTTLVNLLIATLLFAYWRRQATYPGFGFWTASHALVSSAYLLIALRGQIPDILSIVLAQALISLVASLRLEGLRFFIDGIWRRSTLIVYPLLVIPPMAYFSLVVDDILVRTIIINLFLTFIVAQMLAILWRKARQPGEGIYWAPFFFFTVFILSLLARFVVLLLSPEARAILAATTTNNAFFLTLLLHDIGLAVSYLMLNNKRRADDLQQTQADLQRLNDNLRQQVQEETERRLAQERLLAHHARLSAMGEMVGVIAHQWRQPLTTLGMILQRLELMHNRGQLTAAGFAEARQAGMRQIESMSETIDDFRNFYSPDRVRSSFPVCQKLREAANLVDGAFAAAGVVLKRDCDIPAPGILHGYPNQFVQAIVNLLNNARDATLSCAPERSQANRAVHLKAGTAGGELIITVADNGCGIPPEMLNRIGEPFLTSKEAVGGSGLGLYLTKTIVEDSFGGRLTVRSRPGETVFTAVIPFEARETLDERT